MAYSFEQTEDVAVIKSVLAHPACYRFLHDDFAPAREEWEPIIHPMVKYFACLKNGAVIGMFIGSLHSAVEVEIHTSFLPTAWGRDVRKAAIEFREWIWATFPSIQRIIGKVLPSNKASMRYAEAMGFKAFGIDHKSFMFDGKLQDQIYFGMSRPGVA